MRIDKQKKLSSVTKEILTNPLQTVREISDKTWVSKSTVANYINEDLDKLGRKSPDIIRITTKDKKAIELAQIIIEQSLEKYVEMSEAAWWLDMNEAIRAASLAKEATARYTLFGWDVTDKEWWLKEVIIEM